MAFDNRTFFGKVALEMKIVVASIILSAVVAVSGVAQEYATWGLPEGTRMRIGRGTMYDLAYSPDGSRLAIASSVGIWLYDTATLKEVDLFVGQSGQVMCVAYSPDGSLLAGGDLGWTVRVWDANTGEPELPPLRHSDYVDSVAFSSDGTVLAGASDRRVQIWDAKTGEKRHTITGHADNVTCLAFSPVGDVLVTGSKDRTLGVWNAKTGEELRTINAHTGSVSSLAFSRDGKLLASCGADATLRLWDTDTWELRRIIAEEGAEVTCAAFTPDGRAVVGGCTGRLILWDTQTGSRVHTVSGSSGSVFKLVYSPDGATLVSGSDDMTVRMWDAKSGSVLRSFAWIGKQFGGAAFSPDSRTLAIGGGPHVRLWNTGSGEHLLTFSGHQDTVRSLAFSPVGNTIASGSKGEIWLWDAGTGNHLRRLSGGKGRVQCLAFSPDGGILASGGGHRDDTVRVWDAQTGEARHMHSLHTRTAVKSAAFSPNGGILASAGAGGSVVLWDTDAGTLVRTLKGHSRGVAGVSFSQNGRTLCSANHKKARLWDTATWNYVHVPIDFRSGNATVVFSHDGSLFAIGQNWEIELWNAIEGERIGRFAGYAGRITGLAISPNKRKLAAVWSHGTALIWDIVPKPVANAAVRLVPSVIASPPVGEQLSLLLNIESKDDVSGYEAVLYFDSTALRFVEATAGDFLREGGFSAPPLVEGDRLSLVGSASDGASRGDGTLAALTFEVLASKNSAVTLSELSLVGPNARRTFPSVEDARVFVPRRDTADVNGDGVVNALDLAEVRANFMKIGENAADVNDDGVVDVLDIVRVTGQLEEGGAETGSR